MCCKSFWKRIVSFALALSLGLLAVSILTKKNSEDKNQIKIKPVKKVFYSPEGNGKSGCCDTGDYYPSSQEKSLKIALSEIKPLQIISKPRAVYTDEAQTNNVQGKVVLRVTFMANGQIGAISVVLGLPDGLTEQAIDAAKEIKFKPAKRKGIPYSVTKPVEYTFTIY